MVPWCLGVGSVESATIVGHDLHEAFLLPARVVPDAVTCMRTWKKDQSQQRHSDYADGADKIMSKHNHTHREMYVGQ